MKIELDMGFADSVLQHLCSAIGPRPAGSKAISDARSYLDEQLRAIGFTEVSEEPVKVPHWQPEGTHLAVGSEQNGGLKSVPAVACFGAVFGHAEGRLTVASASEHGDVKDSGSLAGTVVLVGGPEATGGVFEPLGVRLRRLADQGASAVILDSPTTTDLPAIENVTGPGTLPLPCVAVSRSDAERLRRESRNGAVATVTTSGSQTMTDCANLIATSPGTGPDAAETIVLSAHLDSFWNSPGAFDNLTGVVTVLETVRRLVSRGEQGRRSLRVVFFTAEEIGMLGSKSYVDRHEDELDSHRFIYNMDSIFPATARGVAVMLSLEAAEFLRNPDVRSIGKHSHGDEASPEIRPMFCMSSDYLPFILKGIVAGRPADFEDAFPDWSHTTYDTYDSIDVRWIETNATVHERLVRPLLAEPILPWRRLDSIEVSEIVAREGVGASLRAMGFRV